MRDASAHCHPKIHTPITWFPLIHPSPASHSSSTRSPRQGRWDNPTQITPDEPSAFITKNATGLGSEVLLASARWKYAEIRDSW